MSLRLRACFLYWIDLLTKSASTYNRAASLRLHCANNVFDQNASEKYDPPPPVPAARNLHNDVTSIKYEHFI